jgi:hypothetical protein
MEKEQRKIGEEIGNRRGQLLHPPPLEIKLSPLRLGEKQKGQ